MTKDFSKPIRNFSELFQDTRPLWRGREYGVGETGAGDGLAVGIK